jgi:hypothetical protein
MAGIDPPFGFLSYACRQGTNLMKKPACCLRVFEPLG